MNLQDDFSGHLCDDGRWIIEWTLPDGTKHDAVFGSRQSVIEHMPKMLSDIKGAKFPSIDMSRLQVDETITIETPKRRAGDE